jgi:TPP-dependent pyruvate/acetoin dehydrogenase alpha subunit
MNKQLAPELYRKLYLARRSEEHIVKHYSEDGMKTPMHMSMGEEAIAVGVCSALGDRGQVFTSYRSHAAYLAQTDDVDGFFGELYGRVSGVARGKAGSMHLSNPHLGFMGASAIVASSIPPAVGLAFANRYNKKDRTVAVFFGDGALDEGAFWESFNVACLWKIPLLFICEDNRFAVHTPRENRQGYQSIIPILRGFNCFADEADGSDVEIVWEKTRLAANDSVAYQRPTFLRFHCYRYLEHVGVNCDFEAKYRPYEEYKEWLKHDPVSTQRDRLLHQGFCEEDIEMIERKEEDRIKQAIIRAQTSPLPSASELFNEPPAGE